LLQDIESKLPAIWGRRLISIFFGGGTPSLFSPSGIEKILEGIHRYFNFGNTEITLEANPGTVDESRFKDFRKAGINRLSIGIQSLQDAKLKSLGRIHHAESALRAIECATSAGFQNFNLDLMHGLPNQSVDDALSDLDRALQYDPPHLSWYQLTIEPQTYFYKNPPTLPDDEILFEIQEKGKIKIESGYLKQYEISAFAKENHECVHNKNYWEFGDYIGIGAGAHSKITDVSNGMITRFANVKHPKEYLNPKKSFTENQHVLKENALIFEFMLNTLRLTHGVPLRLFTARTGLSQKVLEPMLSIAREKGLLMLDKDHLCATDLGQRFLNDLIGIFLNVVP